MPAHCATKFDPPRCRPQHLLRRRQLAAIDPHARLLLACASAGYGRTTLLRQWIARDAGRPAAWIQLAPEDDGPFAFWIAVVSGIAGACPQVGRRSLGALAATVAWTHHERWDAKGYPRRLPGEQIPRAGRIVAICDVFDALTSDRAYRPALALGNAVAQMRAGHGTAFDPELLDIFFASLHEFLRLGGAHLRDGAAIAG